MLGIDVCRRLRLNPDLPSAYVLLLADARGQEDLLEGLNAGADDFLFAPLEPVETRARIRTGARIVETEQALKASQDALRVQSTRDAITGSWNHATILDMLQKERERARRKSGSVGVVLADLDEFRKVNESLGHPVGDEVLREAARRMNSSVRPYDAVGRYGGRGVPDRAARLRRPRRPDGRRAHPREFRQSPGPHLGRARSGDDLRSASRPRAARPAATAPALLLAAGSALARAQRSGRNRAALADESGLEIDAVPPEG